MVHDAGLDCVVFGEVVSMRLYALMVYDYKGLLFLDRIFVSMRLYALNGL